MFIWLHWVLVAACGIFHLHWYVRHVETLSCGMYMGSGSLTKDQTWAPSVRVWVLATALPGKSLAALFWIVQFTQIFNCYLILACRHESILDSVIMSEIHPWLPYTFPIKYVIMTQKNPLLFLYNNAAYFLLMLPLQTLKCDHPLLSPCLSISVPTCCLCGSGLSASPSFIFKVELFLILVVS